MREAKTGVDFDLSAAALKPALVGAVANAEIRERKGDGLGAVRKHVQIDRRVFVGRADKHRSYRNPLGVGDNPRYDNPFFTMNQNRNTSLVNRMTGRVNVSYTPMNWLGVSSGARGTCLRCTRLPRRRPNG